MNLIEKLKKRKCFPVTLESDETIHIRTMTFGEQTRAGKLPAETKLGFILGSVLVEDDGQRAFPQGEKESDEDFGNRMAVSIALGAQDIAAIKAAIDQLEKIPKVKVMEKNSDATGNQDSQSDSPVVQDSTTPQSGSTSTTA